MRKIVFCVKSGFSSLNDDYAVLSAYRGFVISFNCKTALQLNDNTFAAVSGGSLSQTATNCAVSTIIAAKTTKNCFSCEKQFLTSERRQMRKDALYKQYKANFSKKG
jgi:hypothetical protein